MQTNLYANGISDNARSRVGTRNRIGEVGKEDRVGGMRMCGTTRTKM